MQLGNRWSLVFETHLPLMSLTGRDAQLESPSCKKSKVPPRAARPSLGLKFPSPFQPGNHGDSGQMIGVRSMTGACKSWPPEPPKPKPTGFPDPSWVRQWAPDKESRGHVDTSWLHLRPPIFSARLNTAFHPFPGHSSGSLQARSSPRKASRCFPAFRSYY